MAMDMSPVAVNSGTSEASKFSEAPRSGANMLPVFYACVCWVCPLNPLE